MYSIGSFKVSKWQLALMLGTPLAIGVGVYVYNKCTDEEQATSDATKDAGGDGKSIKSNKKKEQKKLSKEQESISLDGGGTIPTDNDFELKKKNAELEAEKLSPLKEATMYKNEGNNCYRKGKYDEAIIFYDKAIDKCPIENRTDMAIFYQNRAASYEMLRKWSKVKDDCSRSLEYNPRYAKAYYRRARAHEATENLSDCLDDVTATCILEMFQNNNTIMFADRVLKETGRLDAERGLSQRVPVMPSATFVKTYLRSFVADPLQSMNIPTTVISDTQLRGFLRAKKAFDEERYDEVIAACTEEIESSEAESQYKAEALLLRGTFYLLSGSYNECKSDFDAVIENTDADVVLRAHALIKRASLYIQLDEKDKGLADFDEAEKMLPNSADVFHQRAQILLLLDQVPQALDEFEKAVKLAPEHANAHIQKCYVEYRIALMAGDAHRLTNVIAEFHEAIDKFPDCVECYSLMAQVLSDQQKFPEAQQFYDKAMKLAPNSPSLLVHQAIMMLQWRGDVEKAVALLNKAIEVDPKCELAYETLGTVEVQRANLERAVELFEHAIKFAKSQAEMVHIYSLRNAAIAQINVTRKLGIDMTTISAMAQSGILSAANM